MTEKGITLSSEQVQSIHRALTAMERELKSMTHAEGWQRPYVVFTNLQAIRAALTPALLRGTN
jgi:hypothetical protein